MKRGRPSKEQALKNKNRKTFSLKLYPKQTIIDLKTLSKKEMEDIGIYFATSDLFVYITWLKTYVPLNRFEPVNLFINDINWTHTIYEPILKRSGTLVSLQGTEYYLARFIGDIDTNIIN